MGDRIALLIGNQNFLKEEISELQPLRGPLNDVAAIGEVLEDPNLGNFVVRKILDKTRQEVIEGIAEALNSAKLGDLVLIYYSGHGTFDRRGKLYLATSDSKRRIISATAIAASELHYEVESSDRDQVVLFLDCCYSGAVSTGLKGTVDDRVRSALNAKGYFILTASSNVQGASEIETNYGGKVMGRFTAAIVDGIRSGSADIQRKGVILLGDISSHVRSKLPGQSPQYFAHSSKGEPWISRGVAIPDENELYDDTWQHPDMSSRNRIVKLLSIGAAVEHCQMIQHLYAAYSMRTGGKSRVRCELIERWRSDILAVAREEMGHLLTLQNLRLLLRAPPALGREKLIDVQKCSPNAFSLEPLSLETLAHFVYAKMPDPGSSDFRNLPPDDRKMLKELRRRVETWFSLNKVKADFNVVVTLYKEIIDLISNVDLVPDSAFDDASYDLQASWDEWGRGYEPAPYELKATDNHLPDDPLNYDREPIADSLVRIFRMANRTEAVGALVAIASQVEASKHNILRAYKTPLYVPSHFERFFAIYKQMIRQEIDDWSNDVCSNPTIRQLEPDNNFAQITAVVAKSLSELFNQRDRLLLSYLLHSLCFVRTQRNDRPNLRAMLMHRTFGEMYNLKTLAGLLVRTPRLDPETNEDDGKPKYAGPPFEMPFSASPRDADVDIWRVHLDLIETSRKTCDHLLRDANEKGFVRHELTRINAEPYVRTLMALDDEAMKWIGVIIAGRRPREAMRA